MNRTPHLIYSFIVLILTLGFHGVSEVKGQATSESPPPRIVTTTPLPIAIRAPEPDPVVKDVVNATKTPVPNLANQRENKQVEEKIEDCGSLADAFLSLKNLGLIQIPRMGNITWGNQEISSSKCFSEFVIFAQDEDSKQKSLLCPSYKIHQRSDFKYSCFTNFTQTSCGHSITISMEAWSTNGQLYEPSLQVDVNCSLKDNSTTHLFPSKDQVYQILPTNSETSAETSDPKFSAIIINSSISCRWSQWSSWSHCSVSCGNSPGRRSRSRSQNGSRLCSGTENESKKCAVNRCPVDCLWSEWSDWSACSVSCGTSGRAFRKRKVIVSHQFGGKPCIGEDLENRRCSGADCPVDGGWSQWSHWGYCQSKCGIGNRTRTRSCDHPTPENGGRPCEEGNSNDSIDELIRHPRIAEKSEDLPIQTEEQVQTCKLKDCDPVDGRWSKWSRWSTCSVNCGRGKIIRTRSCNSPSPAHGGQKCFGQPSQSRPCFLRRCSEDSETSIGASAPVGTTPKSFFVTTTSPNYRSNLISSRLTHFVRDDSQSTSTSSQVQLPIPHSVDITSVLFQRLSGSCLDKPPFVHGFLGPFVKEGITINRPNRYLRVGEIAYYVCNHGKVIDPMSNQRGFFVACRESNGFLEKMYRRRDGDPEWPICQEPRFCLDPAPKYLGYTPPIPRRHALVNTQILYQCIQRPNVSYTISCFPDGRYKAPNEVPSHPCEQEITPQNSIGLSGNVLRFNTVNVVNPSYEGYILTLEDQNEQEDQDTVLNEKFGWIESPGYPGLTAANYSQFKFSLLSRGYYIRIGIEDVDVQYDEMDIDIDFNDQSRRLTIGESYVVKRHFVITPAYGMFKFRITFQFIAP